MKLALHPLDADTAAQLRRKPRRTPASTVSSQGCSGDGAVGR